MTLPRRDVLRQSVVASLAALLAPGTFAQGTGGPIRPPRLKAGDIVGLVEPASASFERFDIQLAEEVVKALGLVPKRGRFLLNNFGYLGGQDKDRAADLNAMFADKSVKAILCTRGGWGCARLLPYLDFSLMRANPKPLIGFSDITALHMALQAKANMVSFHGPTALSAWGPVSVASAKTLLFEGGSPTYTNPIANEDRLVQRRWRTQTVRGGIARGRLLGGNLTVLTALIGTPYVPSFAGRILFLEDVDEAEYRIDRMFTQLALSGQLKSVAGVVFGQCTDCKPQERGFGGFPLSEVLRQHLEPLGVPVFHGAFFGHIADQYVLPQGVLAEIDADTGTIKLLEPSVS
jgi:muramoyltetrapeptide carboxypeptidase